MTAKYLTLRLYHDPPLADLYTVVTEAQHAGATGIALVPHHYAACNAGDATIVQQPFGWIWRDEAQAPGLVGNTTPLATVQALAAYITKVRYLDLILKPHLDIAWHNPDDTWGYGGWRGFAEPPDAYTWRDAYRKFLGPYITLARATGATLCLGTELYRTTVRFGADWWIGHAQWLRRDCHFREPLTYAANWGWGADAEVARLADLWPALDWIGLDAYYPLAPEPTTDPAVLAAGWDRVKIELAPILARAGRKLLVTEVGYRNDDRCMVNPYDPPAPGAVPSDAGQAACWRAFRAAWPGVPFVAWEGPTGGLPEPEVTHNVLRTPELARLVFAPDNG
jgi:hypothetical protein